MTILGLSIHGDTAFGAIVAGDVVEVPPFDRLRPPEESSTSRSLGVLYRRAREAFRDLSPEGIGILETSKYRGWVYREAVARVRTESMILLAAEREAIPCDVVTIHDAGAVLGVRGGDVLRTVEERYISPELSYGDRRAGAVAAALVIRDRDNP